MILIIIFKHNIFYIYFSVNNIPPFICPLVQMADMDIDVNVVTNAESKIITTDKPIPAWPTTHVSLKKSITPQIFSKHGMSTPLIQPNLVWVFVGTEGVPIAASSGTTFYK